MKGAELQAVAEQSNLSHPKIQELLSHFGASFAAAKELSQAAESIVVTDESQVKEMSAARTARLKLKNIRVDVEHTRKELKEASLREGKAIDGMANIIKALIVPVEEHLEKQEKFTELQQAERLAARHAARVEKLSPFVADVSVYSLRDMQDDAFESLLAQAKSAKEAKDKAEQEAELARKRAAEEAAAEAARVRIENERLKAEADVRERELAEQRRKLKEKEIAELAEARARAEAAEAERQALLAPDRDKLLQLADTLDGLLLPEVADKKAGKLLDETRDFLERISRNLRKKANEL